MVEKSSDNKIPIISDKLVWVSKIKMHFRTSNIEIRKKKHELNIIIRPPIPYKKPLLFSEIVKQNKSIKPYSPPITTNKIITIKNLS